MKKSKLAICVLLSSLSIANFALGGNQKSQASNYGSQAELDINERTGQVSINYTGPTVPSVSQETSVQIALSFSGNVENTANGKYCGMLGLPCGWSYQTYYMEPNSQGQPTVYLAGGQSYVYDSQSLTGMAYYQIKNMKLEQTYNSSSGSATGYQLKQIDGTVYTFSLSGLLLSTQDVFGNKVQYSYESDTANVYNTRLTTIEIIPNQDSATQNSVYGNTITFSYPSDESVLLTFPDGSTNTLNFSETQFSVKNAIGQVTKFTWDPVGSSISQATATYPNGHYQTVLLQNEIKTTDSNVTIPAVSNVNDYPLGEYGIGPYVTGYEYAVSQTASNYTGYPDYPNSSTPDVFGVDPLMASNNTAFTYQVKVTGSNGSYSIDTYNYLHLQQLSQSFTASGDLVSSSESAYACSNVLDTANCYVGMALPNNYQNLPDNYQTPSITQSTIYNPGSTDSSHVHQVKTAYNDYGLASDIYIYNKLVDESLMNSEQVEELEQKLGSTDSSTFGLVYKVHYDYDLPADIKGLAVDGYGVKVLTDEYDCIANTIKRTQNQLNDVRTQISQSKTGLKHFEGKDAVNVCSSEFNPKTLDKDFPFERQVAYSYDGIGRLTGSVTSWINSDKHPGVSSSSSTTSYAMDTSQLDSSGQPYLLAVTDTSELGVVSQTVYDTRNGHKLYDRSQCTSGEALSDCNLETSYTYDGIGRIISITDPTGVGINASYQDYATTNEYNVATITRTDGVAYSKYTDGLGNTHKITTNVINGEISEGDEKVLSQTEYYGPNDELPEEFQDKLTESIFDVQALPQQPSIKIDRFGNRTIYGYNNNGKLSAVLSADGSLSLRDYNYVLQQTDSYQWMGEEANPQLITRIWKLSNTSISTNYSLTPESQPARTSITKSSGNSQLLESITLLAQ